MNYYLSVILGINIGLPVIIIIQIAAVLLGFSIHFYLASRKSLPELEEHIAMQSGVSRTDDLRLEFYEQIDKHEKTQERMSKEIELAKQNEKKLKKQVEDLEEEIQLLEDKLEDAPEKKTITEISSADYMSGLMDAQQNLLDHNQQIGRLLQQMDVLKNAEKKNLDILKSNELLNQEVGELRRTLAARESEIRNTRQHELLSKELSERLRQVYEDFNFLQEKFQKLEGYMADPDHNNSSGYEELQQAYYKVSKECDEARLRHLSLMEENQRLAEMVTETEEQLRESNFHRQQLSKKVAFLEELNHELQQVSGHNKKLEGQLKRINEIEALLARTALSAQQRL